MLNEELDQEVALAIEIAGLGRSARKAEKSAYASRSPEVMRDSATIATATARFIRRMSFSTS